MKPSQILHRVRPAPKYQDLDAKLTIDQAQVWGYHGTTLQSANAILNNGFLVSQNPWEWLGDGIYFWQDAPIRAREWALDWSLRNQQNHDPAVVKAKLNLIDCIDMLDVGWRDVLQELSQEFLALVRSIPEFSKLKNHRAGAARGRHELDAAFFNFAVEDLRRRGVTVRSIRAAITEGNPILPESPLCYKSHVQICILDQSLIEKPSIV